MLPVNVLVHILFIIPVLVASSTFAVEYKTIDTNDGTVRGSVNRTIWKNVAYYSFQGIPYAEKPIGKLRFKAPKPVNECRPTVLNALEFGNTCLRKRVYKRDPYPQDEDCLFLNIYVPAGVADNEKLPVLFFIHGGGFVEGNGNDQFYGPDFLIEKRTILVTINYRLGIFGFISLNSSEYSGNMAFKDQQLALKWTFDNIEHFDGDKNKITVFGQSVGATSTHYHILSGDSRKYFRNAILMSGTALHSVASSEDNNHLSLAKKIAQDLDKPSDLYDEIVEALFSAPAEKLAEYNWSKSPSDSLVQLNFLPVIESPDAIQPFVSQTVRKMYENENLDVNALFQYTSDECLNTKDCNGIPNIEDLNSNFTVKLPHRHLHLPLDSDDYRRIALQIRRFYFGDEVINDRKTKQYVKLLTDIYSGYFVDKSVKLNAVKNKGKTFYVRFGVDSKLNVFKQLDSIRLSGTNHGDDLCYIFRCGIMQHEYEDIFNNPNDEHSKISIQIIESMTDLYTKFARLDIPDVGVEPVQGDKIHFLDVTNDGFYAGLNPNIEANEFWHSIEQELQKFIHENPYEVQGLIRLRWICNIANGPMFPWAKLFVYV